MLVSQILKDKGDLVFTASPHETVAAAAALLLSRRVGALVIVDDQDMVIGILSERDVVFAAPTETVHSLLERMTDRRIRHLPVLKDGRLAGLVSIGDLVKSKIAESEAEAENLKAYISAG